MVGNYSSPDATGVVVINYNAGTLVLSAIDAVLSSSAPVMVYVADNASDDGSYELLCARYHQEPRVRLVRNEGNLGFSRANNRVLRTLEHEYVLLLNPDCIVEPATIERMLAVMRECPDVGMAGCVVRNPDGSEQAGCRRAIPRPWPSFLEIVHLRGMLPERLRTDPIDLSRLPLPDQPAEVPAISGSFMLVRREAIEAVGLMDERYFLHCEDLDWCAAFTEHGWKILFIPSLEVIHYKGACSRRTPVRVLWHKHRGMVRFYVKYLSRHYSMLADWLVITGIWARFAMLAAAAAWSRRVPKCSSGALIAPSEATHGAQSIVAALTAVAAGPIESMRGRAVLVTGGAGFIGRHLVDVLVALGADVRVLTRNAERARSLWADDAVTLVESDLARAEGLTDACRGVHTVFHLASYTHDAVASEEEQTRLHRAITVGGTRAIVEAAAAADVERFVFVSSVKAMGEGGEAVLDETSPCRPESAYGRAKLEAEGIVLWPGVDSLPATVVRLPMVYGPGNKGNLPRLIEAIDRRLVPPLPRIANRRSMVHVADVVQALVLAAVHTDAIGRTYVVTDGCDYSIRQLYEMINAVLGRTTPRWSIPAFLLRSAARLGDLVQATSHRPMPLTSDSLRKLIGSAAYSCDRIRDELGFNPAHTLHDSISGMIAEYRATRHQH